MKRLSFGPHVGDVVGHKNMLYLIRLRWIAVFGQVTTIAFVSLVLDCHLPMPQMLAVLACLSAFNIGSHLRWHENPIVTNGEMFVALLVDVASLTAQLHYSGGASNPFASLYLLQVVLSAVLLDAWASWTFVAIAALCLSGLSFWSTPLPALLERPDDFNKLYVVGLLFCFALNASLLVVLITRISANLRAGDAQLAQFRQRAAEEEHIVRMGLLASGAAHELGTPMATMSVLLGDWLRMKEFNSNPALQEDIREMQTQLQRCKSIVTGILLSAGEVRGESSTTTTLRHFLDELVDEWRRTRPQAVLAYAVQMEDDIAVVHDSALKQTICNLLDNALEASPEWVGLTVTLEQDTLVLSVSDRGPGFSAATLANFGKPYNSTKNRPGSGLGLFLVVNVARSLGGSVEARRGEHGAIVDLRLPLWSIALPEEDANGE
ncbi:ATP-binding protein [Massilia sp. TS11]|uniref:ATP-binding protein n=1 Tax=Massilia sp. TS11 TaxID=2908003 RepID=UPI001EDC7F32|nr:ATP-binding protein [Massilia sp. TS11]MCG2583573.1 ATP-binding protein [Massilia sp. TS11]